MGKFVNTIGLDDVGLPKSIIDKINNKFGYQKYKKIRKQSELRRILQEEMDLPTEITDPIKSDAEPKSLLVFEPESNGQREVYYPDWVLNTFGPLNNSREFYNSDSYSGYRHTLMGFPKSKHRWIAISDNKYTKGMITHTGYPAIIMSSYAVDMRKYSYFQIIFKYKTISDQNHHTNTTYGPDGHYRAYYCIFEYNKLAFHNRRLYHSFSRLDLDSTTTPYIARPKEDPKILYTNSDGLNVYSTILPIPNDMPPCKSCFSIEELYSTDSRYILDILLG